jgi:hypothetical protein
MHFKQLRKCHYYVVICRIRGSRGRGYEEFYLLGYNSV